MPCPTCYRELVVPQASSNGSKLILNAAEVQTRPVPANPVDTVEISTSLKRSATPAILLVLFLLTIGAAAFVFREKLFPRTSSESLRGEESGEPGPQTASPAFTLKRAPSDADANWTLELAGVQIPETPVAGRVHGFSFSLDRATITGGTLQLRQGSKWPPDLGVTVSLFAERGEDLAGKTITIESTRVESPKVTLRWKNPQLQPATENQRGSYALRLEFGAVTGKLLPGRIYLATQDAEKSFLSGTFAAEIRKPPPPKQ
jgi:hypothetical protein